MPSTMLELRPNCERCQSALPADSPSAFICSHECTFCRDCSLGPLLKICPNCQGELLPRPARKKTSGADLRVAVHDNIATLCLHRPKARNAYSEAMIHGVCESLNRFEQDPSVRVVILKGAGPSFCAGGDLKAMRDRSGMFAGDPLELRDRYHQGIGRMSRALAKFPKPLIAAIHGPAIGAGLDLACMCDIRIASSSARFGSTFVKVGLIPGDGGALFLSRAVGFSRALELVMSGRVIDADEALRMGLIHQRCEDRDLDEQVLAYAQALAQLAPGALRMAKQLCYASAPDTNIEAALHMAAAAQGLVQHHPDHAQALADMSKKR